MQKPVRASGRLVCILVPQLNTRWIGSKPVWRGFSLHGLNQWRILVKLRSLCQRKVVDILLIFELHLERFIIVPVVLVPRFADDLLDLLQIKSRPFKSASLVQRIARIIANPAMRHLIPSVDLVHRTRLNELLLHCLAFFQDWLLSLILHRCILIVALEVSSLAICNRQVDILVSYHIRATSADKDRVALLPLLVTSISEARLGIQRPPGL